MITCQVGVVPLYSWSLGELVYQKVTLALLEPLVQMCSLMLTLACRACIPEAIASR